MHSRKLIILACAMGIFLIALLSGPPSFDATDGAEFAVCGSELQIAHPPGYPLFLMLIRLFSMIFSPLYGHLRLLNCFIASAALIAGMSSDTDPSILADKLLEMGSKQVIITIGSKGALFADGTHKEVVETVKVKAVDSTAAGDTFNGYLAVALGRGDCMIDAIKLANKAASVSVTRMGAQASVPTIEEL